MGIDERGLLTNEGNVGVREDALDTSTELGHNLCHTFTSLIESSRMDVGLRGDATHIETGAPYVVTLEDHNLQALFGGIFSGTVATRPRADDNQISCCH